MRGLIIFNAIVFTAFGVGVLLTQMLNGKMPSGFWFLGIGLLLMLASNFFSTEEYF